MQEPKKEASGLEPLQVSHLFDDAYLVALYSGRRSKIGSLKYLVRRISQLRAAAEADVIWLEKEALPWVPWPIEKLFTPRGVRVVSDYDDAVFHSYDKHRSTLVRRLVGQKIDKVMAASSIVFAGNEYLAARAMEAGAPDIRHIPTVVDTTVYGYRPTGAPDGKARVGWIGTPKTWAEHGLPMQAMLQDLLARHGAVFRAIGAGKPERNVPGFEFPPWSEETEVSQIQGLDIGIMPLTDTPFARGKCGFKLIQYMACGLPVVASPIGVNRQIVEHGVNGYLASGETEWRFALTSLLSDPELRRRMGEAGRKKVVSEYSMQVYGPKVAGILSTI